MVLYKKKNVWEKVDYKAYNEIQSSIDSAVKAHSKGNAPLK